MDYIIVQAGGKGTRLGYLTKNKPKPQGRPPHSERPLGQWGSGI